MQQINSAADCLQSAHNVLLILDLSLRDFLLAQSYLSEFVKQHPLAKIDLWINSDCRCFFGHKRSFQEKFLSEFLQECLFINKVYFNTCSVRLFKQNYKQAWACKYSHIILFGKQYIWQNIEFAKKLNPDAFLIGPSLKVRWFNFFKKRTLNMLSAKISSNELMDNIFGSQILEKFVPLVSVPRKWITYAKLRFMKWEIDKKGQRFRKVFFINIFDDHGKCKFSLDDVLKLVKNLKRQDEWDDVSFILYSPPSELVLVRKFFAKHSINNMILFSADHNFFQIPSILSLCDGVFSVDGFCADLAKIFNVKTLN